jgi:hypothetical protein
VRIPWKNGMRKAHRPTGKTEDILQKLKNKKNHSPNDAFTACTAGISLLETVTDAAEIVAKLADILLSTARSSFDELQNARKCGQKLYATVESISWGSNRVHPNITGKFAGPVYRKMMNAGKYNFSFRGFLREKHATNNSITQTSLEKGRRRRQTHE